jgi:hypothetical protein
LGGEDALHIPDPAAAACGPAHRLLQHMVGAGQLRRRQAVQVVLDQEQLKVCVLTRGHRRAASGDLVAAPATVAITSAIPHGIRWAW